MSKASLAMWMILLLVCVTSSDAQYYHCRQDTVPLLIDSTKALIKLDQNLSPPSHESLLASIDRIVSVLDDPLVLDNFLCCSLSTGIGYNEFLDSVETIEGIYLVEPYYLNEYGASMPAGERLIVAFDKALTTDEIDSINAVHGVITDHLIYGFESIYVLRNTDSSGSRVLDLANQYHAMSNTHFAQPEFSVKLELHAYTLYDWYHPQQDHLKRVIGDFNQRSVWDFTGWDNPIIVAVLDDGLMPHEDLPASRILPGYDFVGMDENVQPYGDDSHGIACTGILAASHSLTPPIPPYIYTGMVSINPNVYIIPLRIGQGGYVHPDTSRIAAAFNWALINGADVVANSWGNEYCVSSSDVDSAILRLYHEGRNGLGTPLIFSSGNYGEVHSGVAWPACMAYYTFAVGACDLEDRRWPYSQYGSHLDVLAPSGPGCPSLAWLHGVWTLDQMGDYGYNDFYTYICGNPITWDCPMQQTNDPDYNCRFSGTSAASPLVSGIASLLISRRPDLPVDSIYKVLRISAVTELEWGYTVTPHDFEYGYGRVDGFRAMLAITRGDANNDASVDVSDAVYLITHIFKGHQASKFVSPTRLLDGWATDRI